MVCFVSQAVVQHASESKQQRDSDATADCFGASLQIQLSEALSQAASCMWLCTIACCFLAALREIRQRHACEQADGSRVLMWASLHLSCDVDVLQGDVESRFTVGLPARGRTVLGDWAARVLTSNLPRYTRSQCIAPSHAARAARLQDRPLLCCCD